MRVCFLGLVSLSFLASAWAEEKNLIWHSDPHHPSLQYRFACIGGSSERIIWRNGYPGAVTLKARIKNFDYDGAEEVQIEPGATTNSNLQTQSCGNFDVSVARFSMATPPPPPAPVADAKPTSAAAPKPVEQPAVSMLLRFDPQTEPVPEITTEALASINVGMNQAEVRRRLGAPISKMSIPGDEGLIETHRYNVAPNGTGVVKFANGIVTGVVSSR
jgi:hypothetical protein